MLKRIASGIIILMFLLAIVLASSGAANLAAQGQGASCVQMGAGR